VYLYNSRQLLLNLLLQISKDRDLKISQAIYFSVLLSYYCKSWVVMGLFLKV